MTEDPTPSGEGWWCGWLLGAFSCYAHLSRLKVRASLALLRKHVLRGPCAWGYMTPALCDMSLHFLLGHHDESEKIDSRDKETVVGGADSLPKLWDAPYIR